MEIVPGVRKKLYDLHAEFNKDLHRPRLFEGIRVPNVASLTSGRHLVHLFNSKPLRPLIPTMERAHSEIPNSVFHVFLVGTRVQLVWLVAPPLEANLFEPLSNDASDGIVDDVQASSWKIWKKRTLSRKQRNSVIPISCYWPNIDDEQTLYPAYQLAQWMERRGAFEPGVVSRANIVEILSRPHWEWWNLAPVPKPSAVPHVDGLVSPAEAFIAKWNQQNRENLSEPALFSISKILDGHYPKYLDDSNDEEESLWESVSE